MKTKHDIITYIKDRASRWEKAKSVWADSKEVSQETAISCISLCDRAIMEFENLVKFIEAPAEGPASNA
jgi:hypothetical protein